MQDFYIKAGFASTTTSLIRETYHCVALHNTLHEKQ